MQSAQHKAMTKLTYIYPEEYRQYYQEAKDKKPEGRSNSYAQSKARTKLSKMHPVEYRILYEEAARNGYIRSHSLRTS